MDDFQNMRQRENAMHEIAAKINAGRKPKFGDLMRGLWASPTNPQRDGFFVKAIRTAGRVNPGLHYELTDGAGKFWAYGAKDVVFVDHLKGDEVFP